MGNSSDFGITKYGSYSDKIAEMSAKYTKKSIENQKKNNQSEYVFFDSEGANVGHAYRENIQTKNFFGTDYHEYADAVVFDGDIMYGVSSKDEIGLDRFDYIQKGDSQFAIDLNRNNVIEDNEVFNGKIDIEIYRLTLEFAEREGKPEAEMLKDYFKNLKIYRRK